MSTGGSTGLPMSECQSKPTQEKGEGQINTGHANSHHFISMYSSDSVCVCVKYVCTSSAYKLYDLCIYIYIYIRMYIAMICTYYINIFIVLWWCFMYLCNGMAAHVSNVMISHIIGVALLTRDAQLPQPTGPPDSNQLASGIKIEEATLLMPSYWSMWANEVALSEATLSNRQIYE